MEIFNALLPYVLTGGVSALVTAIITIKAVRKSAFAEAKKKEEEAEKMAIENTERWRVSYGNIITDLTEKLERMLKKNNEVEAKYREIEHKYAELERKYAELETQYNRLKNQQ